MFRQPAAIAGVRCRQRPFSLLIRSVSTGQRKLYRYAVKDVIAPGTAQSFLNRYLRRDFRAFCDRS